MNKPASALNLYLVTDSAMCAGKGLIDTVCAAIDGGVTMVQLRDKTASDAKLYDIACAMKDAINGRVPLVINDRVDIAKKAKLDGAHIGQGDLSVAQAREILGPDAWLGLSINNQQQLDQAHAQYLDLLNYFGMGPVFSTQTKKDHAGPIGIEGLQRLSQASQLPTVAIGGINLTNAKEVYRTGYDGIAVVSAICATQNPKQAAEALIACQQGAK